MVERVAELSCRYSGRVHFLLGNHELAELTDYPIMKGRRLLNLAFRTGLYECYGDGADEVRRAMTTYLSSLPLAVRLGELFISHSVPANVDQSPFDHSIFEREPQPEDYFDPGPIFRLVWGRDYRPVNVRKFCDQIGAALLVNGHEPCPRGYRTPNAQQVILDCSDRPASYVILPADGRLSHRDVVEKIELVC